jgi:hypothetical protein
MINPFWCHSSQGTKVSTPSSLGGTTAKPYHTTQGAKASKATAHLIQVGIQKTGSIQGAKVSKAPFHLTTQVVMPKTGSVLIFVTLPKEPRQVQPLLTRPFRLACQITGSILFDVTLPKESRQVQPLLTRPFRLACQKQDQSF